MDFVAFSHLRWNFVFQRPQHLLSRFAAKNRIFYWEEPVFAGNVPFLEINQTTHDVYTIVPQIPKSLSDQSDSVQEILLADLGGGKQSKACFPWYYTPMATHFSR